MELIKVEKITDIFKIPEKDREGKVFLKESSGEIKFICPCYWLGSENFGLCGGKGWKIEKEKPLSIMPSFRVFHKENDICHFYIKNGEVEWCNA